MISLSPDGAPGDWALVLDASGADLAGWPRSDEGASNDTRGTVLVNDDGDLVLRTSGADGNDAAIESPDAYEPGVIEARLLIPGHGGLIPNWPAFWLLGANWPTGGELDAFEAMDGLNYASYWHGPDRDHVAGPTTGESFSAIGYAGTHVEPAGPNIGPGWHTVAVYRGAGYASVYYDGTRYVTFHGTLDVPMKIIINNTQGPNGLRPPGAPSDLIVGYCRAWRPA